MNNNQVVEVKQQCLHRPISTDAVSHAVMRMQMHSSEKTTAAAESNVCNEYAIFKYTAMYNTSVNIASQQPCRRTDEGDRKRERERERDRKQRQQFGYSFIQSVRRTYGYF